MYDCLIQTVLENDMGECKSVGIGARNIEQQTHYGLHRSCKRGPLNRLKIALSLRYPSRPQ